MQTSPVFHSTSLCSGSHRFGGLEMVSSQNSEEREKETSPRMHPEAFRQSGSQSPDSGLVSDVAPPSHMEVVGRGFQAPPGVGLTQVTRQPWAPHWQKVEEGRDASGLHTSGWVEDVVGRWGAVTFHLPFREHLSVLSLWGLQVQNKSASFYAVASAGLLVQRFFFGPWLFSSFTKLKIPWLHL